MSKRKIESLLKKKNIQAVKIEYVRGVPTPSGYASGWDIEFSEETEDKVYEAGNAELNTFMEFDTTEDALNFIVSLPVIN